jgi:peptide/nickel transport system substrate-binding protein
VREVARSQREPGLAGEINPITRVILLQSRNDRGFADDNVRLAAHHAINKDARSKAFYGGSAVPLPVVATPGTPAWLPDFDYSKYFELNRADKLPEATLYSWDNATGDPEIFAGHLLNPKMPFSAWKGMDVGSKVLELFGIADYEARVAGYKELNKYAVERGATIPLLQSVQTLVRRKTLSYEKFGNGWVLANTMKWG